MEFKAGDIIKYIGTGDNITGSSNWYVGGKLNMIGRIIYTPHPDKAWLIVKTCESLFFGLKRKDKRWIKLDKEICFKCKNRLKCITE